MACWLSWVIMAIKPPDLFLQFYKKPLTFFQGGKQDASV
jgi:hypothetical protein